MSRPVRIAAWILLSTAVPVLSWLSGLATCLVQDDGCTWLQRHAWLACLATDAFILVAFYLLHYLPFFKRDRAVWRSQNLAALLLLPWFIGAFFSGPTFFGAINRGRQKRTMADMRDIGRALEDHRSRYGTYPPTHDASELYEALARPAGVSPRDGWGNTWQVDVTGDSYTIVSFAKCGEPDSPGHVDYSPGVASSFQADIVFANGHFVRWPEGIQAD